MCVIWNRFEELRQRWYNYKESDQGLEKRRYCELGFKGLSVHKDWSDQTGRSYG